MKLTILIVCLNLALPAHAENGLARIWLAQDGLDQDPPNENSDIEDGLSLFEDGARLLFRGITREMEPALDEFSDFAQELGPTMDAFASRMGPAFVEVLRSLDSVRYYEAPEILPNGDILIRRSPDAPDFTPPQREPQPDSTPDVPPEPPIDL